MLKKLLYSIDYIAFIIVILLTTIHIVSYIFKTFNITKEAMNVKGYKNYVNDMNNQDDELKILAIKNAGNISALKDAIDTLIQTATNNKGRLSALEKQYSTMNNVLQETKAMADETKSNVEGAVTEYKAQGDQQAQELNDLTFEQ